MAYGLSTVYFGGVDISDILKTQIIRYNLMEYPTASTNTQKIAMVHRSSSSRYFVGKTIPLQFYVNSETCDLREMEAIISRLRLMSQTRWKDLKLEAGIVENDTGAWVYSSDDITWSETRIEDFSIEHSGKVAIVSITFISDDPIGVVAVPQTLFTDTAVTSASEVYDLSTIDLQGTFYLQYPKYTITINSVTEGADPSLSVSNGFATLLYEGSITAGDVFIIDTQELEVMKNGNLVDFDGALPIIDMDNTTDLTVSHTCTALNYDILINNTPGYI